MGFLANTVSICHFRVQGELQNFNLYEDAPGLLAKQAFTPIDESAEEISIGWVHLDDPKAHDFADPSTCFREQYLIFSMRRDQRKVPAALLKEQVDKACAAFLAENPGYTRVPKQKREDLKEAVRAKLLAKALPDPKVYDLVWDTQANLVTFTTHSPKTIEILEDQFKKTFEGLRLVAFIPYERAYSVLDTLGQQRLKEANRAGGESFLELMKENQWIGTDFMGWLLYLTMNEASEYRVNRPGPLLENEPFVAYINDRVVLIGEGEGGTQMITVNGSQDRFNEVKSAMQCRKKITEATIHLESGDYHYSLILKGEAFHFASFNSPAVRIERDADDQRMEHEAVFFERMLLLDKGLQLFNSLFRTFLDARLGSGWGDMERTIDYWVNE